MQVGHMLLVLSKLTTLLFCNYQLQIIDLATLTGACVIALGPSIAGKLTHPPAPSAFSCSEHGVLDYFISAY